uniref:Protein kinase domain-containing protein n=1 Tax=Oryzias melastigma TaxID=30732 RepID=A0A3B3C5R6_ORYME
MENSITTKYSLHLIGTFGTVVIYRQCPTSNQVAVKLSRERLALLQYEHCIVTEKLDQDILHYMCQQSRRPMTVSEIRPIAQQLLVALKALKSMGLVHADIKPNNVMFVDHANYPFKVKLIDFGLARNTYKLCKLSEIQNVVLRNALRVKEFFVWDGCNLRFKTPSEYQDKNVKLTDHNEKEFKSLLKQMLCVNSRKRITPEEALRHDFITMKHLDFFLQVTLPVPSLEKRGG